MNKLTSAIRHRDNKYWVPSEGLNVASSGNCRIVILVPNECLKDSSSGKCGIIMPQSGVGATPHKGLITESKDSACRSRTSERHHIKGGYHILLLQQFGDINYHKHETQNKVSPSTGITIKSEILPLEPVHRGQVFHTDRYGYNVYTT